MLCQKGERQKQLSKILGGHRYTGHLLDYCAPPQLNCLDLGGGTDFFFSQGLTQ